jgi:3-dehydroquinate synthase class II
MNENAFYYKVIGFYEDRKIVTLAETRRTSPRSLMIPRAPGDIHTSESNCSTELPKAISKKRKPAMDKKLRDACQSLVELVTKLDPAKDHDTFAWLHKFLADLTLLVEKKDPKVVPLESQRLVSELRKRAEKMLISSKESESAVL